MIKILDAEEKCQVDFILKCNNLANLDTFGKSDPRVTLFLKDKDGTMTNIGSTEIIQDNLNPVFAKLIKFEYEAGKSYEFQFVVEDEDEGDDFELIGFFEVSLDTILKSRGATINAKLMHPTEKNDRGQITIYGRRKVKDTRLYSMGLKCKGIKEKEMGVKVDPYMMLSKPYKYKQDAEKGEDLKEFEWEIVYRTEYLTDTLSPDFGVYATSSSNISNMNPTLPLKFEIWDYALASPKHHIFRGKGYFSMKDLENGISEFEAFDENGNSAGFMLIDRFNNDPIYYIEDYLRAGFSLSLIFCIDYTGSNGDPQNPKSLHHLHPEVRNQYEDAIVSLGQVMFRYDKNPKIPVYGFGASFPTIGIDDQKNFFKITGPEGADQTYARNFEDVLDFYTSALSYVKPMEPSNLAPCIKGFNAWAKKAQEADPRFYGIAIVLTDGQISDTKETTAAIVDASLLPISFVFIAIGAGDISYLKILDGDTKAVQDYKMRKANRDCVQVVEYRKYLGDLVGFSNSVLEEIPSHVVGYFKTKGIKP